MKRHGVSRPVQTAWAVVLFCVGALVLGWSATHFPQCGYRDLLFGRHPLHFKVGTSLLVATLFLRVVVLGPLWLRLCGALVRGGRKVLRRAWAVACLGIGDAALVFIGFGIVDVGDGGWVQLGSHPQGYVRVGALAWLLVWVVTLLLTRRWVQAEEPPRADVISAGAR
jgi:hypothetical protein